MKVKLSKDGCLTITSETEVESYALDAWIVSYNRHNAVLQMITDLTTANLEKSDKEK